MANVTVKYIGGMDEVYVRFPSGDAHTVPRGGTITILPADAATLHPGDWEGKGVGTAFDVANLPFDCGGPRPDETPPTPDPAPAGGDD